PAHVRRSPLAFARLTGSSQNCALRVTNPALVRLETAHAMACLARAPVGVGYWIGDIGALTPMGGTVQISGTFELTPLTHLRGSVEHASLTAHDDFLPAPVHASLDGASLVLHHA